MNAIDPFSDEARMRRLEARVKELEDALTKLIALVGGPDVYDSSTHDSRIESLEEWRRDIRI